VTKSCLAATVSSDLLPPQGVACSSATASGSEPGEVSDVVPQHATIPDLVEAAVRRAPDAVAVVAGEHVLTYAELDARANRLAQRLQRLGVRPEVVVGVCVERSLEMAVALLGVLKAGGACLPLDPSYPPERLALMLADSVAPVVLTQPGLTKLLPRSEATTVCLDRHWAGAPAEAPPRRLGPDHLAYVLYTSGSTGTPKGVLLTHRGLVNHHRAAVDRYDLGPGDRVLQFCSISFDVSIEELFPTWAAGATVVLRPEAEPILGRGWLECLRHSRVSVMNLPTAYWRQWVRDLQSRGERVPESLRLVVVGGEPASASAYRSWLEVGGERVRWLNAYGPTEASIMTTLYEPPAPGTAPVDRDPPIGRPLPNTTIHLLDPQGQPVPPGAAGEVHIGGVGVARGYLGRPELTAERFVPDPFAERPGARLYRSGDLARWSEDGNLEFLGRLDDQVKVRGVRIECAEVEAALRAHRQVAEAVVVARQDRGGDNQLVAYVVGGGRETPSAAGLRRFLAGQLPPAMVPAAFVALDALPLTPNGKVDRAALPPPVPTDARGSPDAPRTRVEHAIAAIWAEVLGLEVVGVHQDFFDLGGHSLLAAQVIAEVRERFGAEVPLGALFEAPTVAELATRVRTTAWGNPQRPPLVPQPRAPGERLPLSLPQEHLWALEMRAQPPGLYNVSLQRRFSTPVDHATLQAALAHVVARHESLRTSFDTDDRGPYQVVAASVPVELAISDLSPTPHSEREAELRRRVAEDNARPFDLAQSPLFRAQLFDLGEGTSELVVTFDHLISDGTSAYVFVSELDAAYDAYAHHRSPELRPLPIHYGDFALWQRRCLGDEALAAQLEYWKQTLAGMPLGPAVPFDKAPPNTPNRRLHSAPFRVSAEVYDALEGLARSSQTTSFAVVTAAVQALCARHSGAYDVVLSTTTSGRQRAELDGLIGFFAGVGRIRVDLTGDPSFEELLGRAAERILGLFEHQDIPFPRVRQALADAFPTEAPGPRLAALLPSEIHFVRATADRWVPGANWVERPPPHEAPVKLFLRGQLHPLSFSFLDNGEVLWGEVRGKLDFYERHTIERLAAGLEVVLAQVARDPAVPLSELAVER
jgi:amino acid adenylation domain-containing protein